MAATKRKTVSKAKAPKYNSQAWSIILFFFGILLGLFVFIEGGAFWQTIHFGLFGLFGMSVYIVPILVIYVSIMIALDKSRSAVMSKLIQGIILLFLFSGIFQILFADEISGSGFLNTIKVLYDTGVDMHGGGVMSIIFGWPLHRFFGKTGGAIIIILLTITVIFILTNISLVDAFKFITAPFRHGANIMREAREEKLNQPEKPHKEEKQKPEKRKKVNVDIAKFIDDNSDNSEPKVKVDANVIENEQDILPMHPVVSPKATNKSSEVKPQEPVEKVENVKPEEKTEVADLAKLISKAVDVKDKKQSEGKSDIFIQPDGQTCLYKKDNSVNLYKAPPLSLLGMPVASKVNTQTQHELKNNSEILVDTLKSFGVQTRIVGINRGPSVTRYELQPAAGVKVSRITSLTDDIKMALAARSIRIEAPIPGKAAVGIEVPNNEVDVIAMREMLESKEFRAAKSNIAFALGKDITGDVIIADIAKMPHVLIAGATGSGKSVCINSIIISLLYRSSPDDVRLLMIDPKMVELEVYNGIPHLLIPVVTNPRKAAGALSWAVTEMQKRYKLFADHNVRNLTGYNELAEKNEELEHLPQIVIIIDELADLMMVAAKDVEEAICRLAQLARAAGMHLVIATQRPSVDIITGVIKANIPSRIAFAVSSQIDSRTILDSGGAEKLLGRGDMLFSAYGAPKPTRVQGCFVTDKEVEEVVAFIKNQIKADYDENILDEIEKNVPVAKGDAQSGGGSVDSSDEMLEKAIEIIVDAGQASTSYLQRRLKLGYARAARIMDELEQMGIIGESEGSKPRKVLMTKQQWMESQLSKSNVVEENNE